MYRKKNKLKSILIILVVLLLLVIGGRYALQKMFPPSEYDTYILESCEKYDVSPYLVYSVIKAESNFDPEAKSTSDPPAYGLMQITEDTWKDYNFKSYVDGKKFFNPQDNIKIGTHILADLLKKYGDERTALAAYNAGQGTVDAWLADISTSNEQAKVLGDIPYSETNYYCKKIGIYEKIYKFLYKSKFEG